MQDDVHYRGGASILCAPLPELLTRKGYQTTSSAWHDMFYRQGMGSWNIKEDVCKWTKPEQLRKGPLSVLSRSVSQQEFCIDNEHYLCGDEQSVCGRYGQNALGPASAVAFHNDIQIRFGDYKVCYESKKNIGDIPDFVAVRCPAKNLKQLNDLPKGEKPAMMLVGEAKTPWKHDLGSYWDIYRNHGNDKKIRLALGQIASYMHRFKMRYGFLTTYNETIFVRQEVRQGESVLYFTTPIKAISSPKDGENAVSVRQCFYYLLSLINQEGNSILKNTFRHGEWVGSLDDDHEIQDPVTPFTGRVAPQSSIFQVTPTGKRTKLLEEGPLQLSKHGSMFTTTLLFTKESIRALNSEYKRVMIDGNVIRVVINDKDDNYEEGEEEEDDDDDDGDDDRQQIFGKRPSQQRDQTREKRTVSFLGEAQRDRSPKRKGSLFDPLQRAKESSRPTERIGVEARNLRSERDRQAPLNPEQGRLGIQRSTPRSVSPTDIGREFYPHRRPGLPDLSQSPSPAPTLIPGTSQGRSYPSSAHPQQGAHPLPAAHVAEHASRGIPHRPRDAEREESRRHEKPEEGRKLRSSNKSSEQPPPKRSGYDNDKKPPSTGHSIFGRSSKKR